VADSITTVQAALGDRYVLERELGHGGMAEVYLARDIRLNRRVAIKLLRADLGAALGSERFLREIDIASRLTHPHILTLFEAGNTSGRLFYVMPYVEGESLRQRLTRERYLSIDDAIAITRAVAGALDYAHRAGVIHRDIKPENILLARDPAGGPVHPLVADFGIARAVNAAGGERLTQTGLALGTPAYMSPEQASADQRLDSRGDIYSLGCVAYEMLAGAPPFTGPSAQAVLARHSVDPVPPLRTVRRTVPKAVEQAITKALAKVPVDRFATAIEFADALNAGTFPSSPAWQPKFPRRVGLLFAVAAAVILAAAAVAGALHGHRATPTTIDPAAVSMAVLPLGFPPGDTALASLGNELAITINASLDGVGGIKTVDRWRIAQETSARPSSSPGGAAAVARRVGARSVLMGTVVGEDEAVRVDLGLYDATSLAPLAQGISVSAHRDSLRALTDSAVWKLLRQIWRRGESPTPSITAVTTGSLPALRAFVEGERKMENNDWPGAALAYRSALASDSTFWLAYYRYSLAEGWMGRDSPPEFAGLLYRHRQVFPERDRLLVEAWAADALLPKKLDLLQAVVRRYPDYWPGWFLFGDALYHVGPLLGYDWKDAQGALNRAVALNPKLKPAWLHLFQNSVGRDTVESGRALAGLLTVPPDLVGRGLDDPGYNRGPRLFDAVARFGRITPQLSALADTAVNGPVRFQNASTHFTTLLLAGFPAAQIELNRRILELKPPPPATGYRLTEDAYAWAERGNWDSALAILNRVIRGTPATDYPVSAMEEYELAVTGAWLGALDPAEATRRRAVLMTVTGDPKGGPRTEDAGQLAWFDGVLAFARRDRAALDAARQAIRRSGHPKADILDRSLVAFGKALAGHRAAAGRELAELEWYCQSRWGICGDFYPHSPNIAIHRLSAATWLLESGDTVQAAKLLTWHERGVVNEWEWTLTYPVTPFAYLLQAKIEESRGDTSSAIEGYEQFLRRYDSPMPQQRHLVEEGHAAVARLVHHDDAATAQ
jgi:tRNA A-37 threonylcarbamoyl transferase component Bud32/tetratricopeptide (TPR) repeat protein